MDEYSYHSSMQETDSEFIFSNRQYTYINDANNGTYSNGQILFDGSSLANSGRFIDWTQAYITIPLVMNVTFASGQN